MLLPEHAKTLSGLPYAQYFRKTIPPLLQVWKFWVSGVATLVTGLPGVLGNGLSLVVLSRRWGTAHSIYQARQYGLLPVGFMTVLFRQNL